MLEFINELPMKVQLILVVFGAGIWFGGGFILFNILLSIRRRKIDSTSIQALYPLLLMMALAIIVILFY